MIPDESIEVAKWLDDLPSYIKNSNDPSSMLNKFADDLEKTVAKIRVLAQVWSHIIAARYQLDNLKEQYDNVQRQLKKFDVIKKEDVQ